MNTISELNSLLSKQESAAFIKYLDNRNKRPDTKNIALFKALKEGREASIKKELGSNAYNVSVKRLSDRLLDFLANISIQKEASEEITIIKQLLIGRKLFAHGKYKLAYKVFANAELMAIKISHYSLLNEIYHTYIQHSHHELSPDQEALFNRFEENKEEFIQQERLNMAYATIQKAFKAIDHSVEKQDFNELIKKTFKRFNISEAKGYNFQSLYQIAQIADVSGAYNRDYYSIDLFFVDKVNEIQGTSIDTEKYLDSHIEVLFLIANIYFRKKMFQESLNFLDKMLIQMNRSNQQFFNKHFIKYSSLKALNHNYIGDYKQAEDILDSLIKSNKYKFDKLLNPLLARMMIHFQQGELKAAQRILGQFHKMDTWYEKHVGLDWTLYKNFMEILLHIELGNIDFVDSRINSLIRKYGKLLKTDKEKNAMAFLKVVKQFYQNPEIIKTKNFLNTVEKTVVFKPSKQEDIILMSFYAWLKAKMEDKPLYETTCELVKL